MTGRDLPFLRGGAAAVARQAGEVILRTRFLAEIEELAAQLPDRPYIVNLCADRYRFTVAWAAAMLRSQITLLPGGRDVGSVAAMRADYPASYVLTDDTETFGGAPDFAYPRLLGSGTGNGVPAFPADRIAAVLFTSGSTGRPTPNVRRWGRLVRGCLAAGQALGISRYPGAAVVATVPHAHSYGLESAVMLPLQFGLLLTAERPFFPADVAAALADADRPGILITTPVHLRAMVGDAQPVIAQPVIVQPVIVQGAETGFGAISPAAFVLSATAPLSADLAVRTEAAFNAPVFEIYGCSEAGQVATRRTIDGPAWRCLDGFALHQDSSGTWASGPDEDAVLLADEIEVTGDSTFILQGRTADMVNIAGKRSSLAYLTRQLLAIDGVRDGAFLMPEDGAAGEAPRLAAVAVAPGMDAAAILAKLREQIDAAFLPRPLLIVAALPRNALGKLPRADIVRMFGSAAEATASPAPVIICFPADHPTSAGHFPGNPIIPGAVLLDRLLADWRAGGWAADIEAAKFHHPVRPGDAVSVACGPNGSAIRFEGRLAQSGTLVLSGVARSASPANPRKA